MSFRMLDEVQIAVVLRLVGSSQSLITNSVFFNYWPFILVFNLEEKPKVKVAHSFSLLHTVQSGCIAHSASYPTDTRSSFPRKSSQGEVGHTPPSWCQGQE
jgi:hypothetical protein